MARIAAFWQWHSLYTTYVGPNEVFKEKGWKKAFETTAGGGEIIPGPVKEFVQFFCQMAEVIFCLLFCWFASVDREILLSLDAITHLSKKKKHILRPLGVFSSPQET